MTVESAADRLVLLEDFGVTASFGFGDVTGIFNAPHEMLEGGAVEIDGEAPTLLCRSADIASAGSGDSVTIEGATYEVYSVQPDGTGMTLLELRE